MAAHRISPSLTYAGRRKYCVEVFKQAAGDKSRVLACDSNAVAAAIQKADKAVLAPRIDDDDYGMGTDQWKKSSRLQRTFETRHLLRRSLQLVAGF